jgi:SAM-dependent MidA family methyltransferase
MICVGDSLNKNLVINHLIWLLINGSHLKFDFFFQLVEFGPGRGTLMQDVLRTFMKITPESLNKVPIQ